MYLYYTVFVYKHSLFLTGWNSGTQKVRAGLCFHRYSGSNRSLYMECWRVKDCITAFFFLFLLITNFCSRIIHELIASAMPTAVLYVSDTARCVSPTTFMSNMLYATSVLYKSQLPMVCVFNKGTLYSHVLTINNIVII